VASWILTALVVASLVYSAYRRGERTRAHDRRTIERQALVRLDLVHSAMQALRHVNGGFGGPPECLRQPSRCLPELETAPPLMAPEIVLDAPMDGYVLSFRQGVPAAPEAIAKVRTVTGPASPASLVQWVFTAEPVDAGSGRAFCLDSGGGTCAMTPHDRTFVKGRCPATCVYGVDR
jgi:hypothetical protein